MRTGSIVLEGTEHVASAAQESVGGRRAGTLRAWSIAAGCLVALAVPTAAFAHHGFGRFDRTKPVEIEGTITGIDFVNPHSYLHLDVVGSAR